MNSIVAPSLSTARSHYFEARLSRRFDAVIHPDVTGALAPLK